MPEVAVLTESTVGPARFRAGEGTAGMAVDRDTEWTIDGNGHVMVWHGRQGSRIATGLDTPLYSGLSKLVAVGESLERQRLYQAVIRRSTPLATPHTGCEATPACRGTTGGARCRAEVLSMVAQDPKWLSFTAPWLARHASCAVVLNGASLRGEGHGNEIDQHAAVWRLNDSPTVGYGADVGEKTTYRFVNAGVFVLHQGAAWQAMSRDPNATFIAIQPEPVPYLERHFGKGSKRFSELPRSFRHTANQWLQGCALGCDASIGFQASLLAMAACDSVDVYGMGLMMDGSYTFTQYRDADEIVQGNAVNNNPGHDLMLEWDILLRLDAAGLLRVVQRPDAAGSYS